MDGIPAIDPIPLPAPVWLFKALHTATLALHFSAVHFMVGGILFAVWWSFLGRRLGDARRVNAGGLLAHRLPVVMAFVINLGVPPLLFAQVLYGPMLYTSSVLMGVFWIAVVFLIMAAYYLLYRMATRAENGLGFTIAGLVGLALVMKVGLIYSTNMTLMLRPDAWVELYRQNPTGMQMPTGGSTLPRWLYMMVGSASLVGIFLMLVGMKRQIPADAAAFLRSRGGLLIAVFTVVQVVAAIWVFRAQPEAVRAGLMGNGVYQAALAGWGLTALLLVALGVLAIPLAAVRSWLFFVGISLVAFLNLAAMVIFRDGIRDVTLQLAGYNVWQREVVTNWSVVGLFLVLFVIALGFAVWMIWVAATAKGVKEQYA